MKKNIALASIFQTEEGTEELGFVTVNMDKLKKGKYHLEPRLKRLKTGKYELQEISIIFNKEK